MSRRLRNLICALPAAAFAAVPSSVAFAGINVELRPSQQNTVVGDFVDIALYAVSDNAVQQSIGAMSAVLVWDPSLLELVAHIDNGTYEWLQSWFPDDSGLDGLNFPFEGTPPFVPDNDGDAFFDVWSQWGSDPAQATPEGLLVTTFRFRALSSGAATLATPSHYGLYSRTRVVHGAAPGLEVTGLIGPPAQVTILPCAAPEAEAEGSRYIAVTPVASDHAAAILVTGDAGAPGVSCVALYVQPDGRLGSNPVYRTPAQWGTVHVSDSEIIPSATYDIQLDCGGVPGRDLSASVGVTTWVWGDVDNDGVVNGDDGLLVLDAANGLFETVTLPNVDLAGDPVRCRSDGRVDADDVMSVWDAIAGIAFPCPALCSPGPALDDYQEFAGCLVGPGVTLDFGCESFDIDNDNDVDLQDFSRFQITFAGS